ncbi:serine protease [Phenylobacterium sp.]|uniref:serine protease n=1 Tax=Phenylobacterium sp. TaxID=1871053 RepID=UPI002DF148C2|nr:serine protease [Phenylobacterium sp.]
MLARVLQIGGLALAGTLTASGAARAADWAVVAESSDGVKYDIDVSTIGLDGRIARSWIRETLPQPKRSVRSGKDYVQIVRERFDDCEHHRFSSGTYVFSDAQGRTTDTGTYAGRPWEGDVPGSVSESMGLTACALTAKLSEKPFLDDIRGSGWTDLGPAANGTYRLNVKLDEVIKLDGGYVATLMRTDYNKTIWINGLPVRYVVAPQVIECSTGKSAPLGGDFYINGTARVAAKRTPENKLDFQVTSPNSFIAKNLQLICGSAHEARAEAGGGRREGGYSVGTAWAANKGYLVTASHVIAGGRRIYVFRNGEKVGEARVVSDDPANDLAILKYAPAKPGKLLILPIAPRTATLGRSVFTLGYPEPEALGQHVKMTAGQVSSTAGYQDDARYLQISVPVQEGNSGGPLIGPDGAVLGVIEAKLMRFDDRKDNPAPENVNYALKSSYIRPMLEDLPDLANYTVIKPQPSLDQLIAEARKAVFMVVVSPKD